MSRYYTGPVSDHFDGRRFFNPGQPAPDRGLADIWRWKRGERAAVWPQQVAITPAVPAARVEGLRVTMVGHASLLIQVAGRNILTDPVWSDRASPSRLFGPRRVTAPGIAFADLPPIDAVLVSHNHYDHLDLATLARLHARDRPVIAAPLGNDRIVQAAINDARVVTGDWGDRLSLGEGAATTLVRANHWSARGVRDRRMALWAGHWLEVGGHRIWFAGDTGYGDGAIFAEIRQRHGVPDLALVPIGAYAPRWFMAPQHCDPEEAVRIVAAVEAPRALGIHWGTFQLTDEAREEPAERLAAATAARGWAPDRFVAAVPGEVYDFAAPPR